MSNNLQLFVNLNPTVTVTVRVVRLAKLAILPTRVFSARGWGHHTSNVHVAFDATFFKKGDR